MMREAQGRSAWNAEAGRQAEKAPLARASGAF
jgi:hypothetical protein